MILNILITGFSIVIAYGFVYVAMMSGIRNTWPLTVTWYGAAMLALALGIAVWFR